MYKNEMENTNKIIMYNNLDNNHVAIVPTDREKKDNDNRSEGNIIIVVHRFRFGWLYPHNSPNIFISFTPFSAFVRKQTATWKRDTDFYKSDWLTSMLAEQKLTVADRLLNCYVSAVRLSMNE